MAILSSIFNKTLILRLSYLFLKWEKKELGDRGSFDLNARNSKNHNLKEQAFLSLILRSYFMQLGLQVEVVIYVYVRTPSKHLIADCVPLNNAPYLFLLSESR